jgi:hypothetical protein
VKDGYTALRITTATALAVVFAFLGIVPTRILREFTHAGLEGGKFGEYYSLFVPSIWIFLTTLILVCRNKAQVQRVWFWALAGALAGYVSGIISVTFIELFRPDGWKQLILQSQRSSSWAIRMGYPLIALNWLVGLVAGILGFGIVRLGPHSRSN